MDRTDKRLVVLWGLMILLTFVSWESSPGGGMLSDPKLAIGLILGLAFIKVRIVVMDFMEVRHAPLFFRLAVDLWIVGMAVALIWLRLRGL